MNILFLTTGRMEDIEQHSIYPDLLRQFRDHGHTVYCVGAFEKRTGKKTELVEGNGAYLLHVKIGNLTKTNIIEKGISTLLIGWQYLSTIKQHFGGVKFDLILYSTPPITLVRVIEYFKQHDHAKTYLLLKDIFPQNAVDLGMMSKQGLKTPIYWYFRRKEKKLYSVSDRIGCMSQANVDYVLRHNPEVDPAIVGVCPNSIEVVDMTISEAQKIEMRQKYDLPLDKKIFVYGGNLGKPQGIPFLIDCLRAEKDNQDAFFLIVGDGTEYEKLNAFVSNKKPTNVKLMKRLSIEDYDRLIAACDVGMIFLDHRFTIPNFPSRLLSYMQAGLPVLACTDSNTDIGKVIEEGSFGWWCESNDVVAFEKVVDSAIKTDFLSLGKNAREYLINNFSVNESYKTIIKSMSV